MYYIGWNKTGSNKKISEYEEQLICYYYQQIMSISKTAKEIGYSKGVVERACKKISSRSIKSRYNNNIVYQINLETGEIIKEFKNGSVAAKELNLNYISLNRCLNSYINNCGGYGWCYKKNYNKYKLPKNYALKLYSLKKIDKLLGL